MATRPVGSLRTREYDLFRALLRETRIAKGISQEALSIKLGQPIAFGGKTENGTRRLDIIEVVQICEALGVDPTEFMKELYRRLKIQST